MHAMCIVLKMRKGETVVDDKKDFQKLTFPGKLKRTSSDNYILIKNL